MLDVLYYILLILYIPACLGLIVLVLLQKGKGTGFAGAFGAGTDSAVFGPRASRSLPIRLTYIFAATFMTIALIMSIISGGLGKGQAPGLEEVEASADAIAGISELSDLNIGTGATGAARSAESPAVEPVSVEGEPAPAEAAPATTEAATVEETPVTEPNATEPPSPGAATPGPGTQPETATP